MKTPLFLLLMFATLFSSCSKQPKQDDFDDYTKTFFLKYEKEGVDSALNYIFSTNPIASPADSQLVELKAKLNSFSQMIGGFNGYELIVKKKATKDYIYCSYLVKHDIRPVRFVFIYYRPKGKWFLQQFNFDTDIDGELQNAGSVYFLSN